MPDKPLTIATYAVSASVAAIVLGYVFGPSLFPDDGGTRKRSAIGLVNPANDCFINSVLQAFAGLRPLRDYLARESQLHAREPGAEGGSVDGVEAAAAPPEKQTASRDLQDEIVTRALNVKVAALSETATHKKTISAGDFVRVLEFAFDARISRQQQDAQEFLHLVAERLCDEFHACRKDGGGGGGDESAALEKSEDGRAASTPALADATADERRAPQCFPLEGRLESHIECQTCRFRPRANASSFVTLTLNVPQKSATTLDDCLDGLLKAEYIDGYKCDRCRVQAAIATRRQRLAQLRELASPDASTATAPPATPAATAQLERELAQLDAALADPEAACAAPSSSSASSLPTANANASANPPPDVTALLPPASSTPQRRIAKHTRIAAHPPLLALHLSRSIFRGGSGLSAKNQARVDFPEALALGGLAAAAEAAAAAARPKSAHDKAREPAGTGRVRYRLACVVTHRGGHNSGHYETYRRQSATAPALALAAAAAVARPGGTAVAAAAAAAPTAPARKHSDGGGRKRRDREGDAWWCISDDKVRACRTRDVLGKQKEAYLLFYERVELG